MSYTSSMSTATDFTDDCEAVINVSQLVLAVEDIGYDEVDVQNLDSGFALTVDGVTIAIGVGDTPLEASENLLDRAADIFYYEIPTV